MLTVLKEFYGEDPKTSTDYGRIVSDRYYWKEIMFYPFS